MTRIHCEQVIWAKSSATDFVALDQQTIFAWFKLQADSAGPLLFYLTEEAQEGRNAYQERRPPDFAQFPKRP